MNRFYYIVPIFIIFLLIGFAITLNNSEKQETLIDTSYSFYKEDLKDRYIAYKERLKLNDKMTILNVNMGLDRPFYTNPKQSIYLNTNYVLVNKYNYFVVLFHHLS